MRRTKIDESIRANKIAFIQTRGEIIHVNHVVRDRALRAQLLEDQISHLKIRSEDCDLAVTDSLLPLNLRCDVQWPGDLVRRIGSPIVAELGRVPRKIHLR